MWRCGRSWRMPCRPAEIPRHRAGQPPADRHPPDAGGAAPPARRPQPVPRAPSARRGRLVRALAAEAKWLAGECAPARDLHVFLTETVADVPPDVRRIAQSAGPDRISSAPAQPCPARASTAFDGQLDAFVQPAPARHRRAARRLRPRRARHAPRQGRAARPQARRARRRGACTGCASPSRSCATPRPSCGRPLPSPTRRRRPISRRQCACRARSAP